MIGYDQTSSFDETRRACQGSLVCVRRIVGVHIIAECRFKPENITFIRVRWRISIAHKFLL